MYFDRNICENKYGKKSDGSYLSWVTNGEFYLKGGYPLDRFYRPRPLIVIKSSHQDLCNEGSNLFLSPLEDDH